LKLVEMVSNERKVATNKKEAQNVIDDVTQNVTDDVTDGRKLTPVQSMAKLIEMDLEKKNGKRRKVRSR
jgi:hypothetical protein